MQEPIRQPLPNQVSGAVPDQAQISAVPRPEAPPVPVGAEQRPMGEVGEFVSSSNPLPVVDAAVAPFAQPVQVVRLPEEPVKVELPRDPVAQAKIDLARAEKDSRGKPDLGKTWGGKLREFSLGKWLAKLRPEMVPEGV